MSNIWLKAMLLNSRLSTGSLVISVCLLLGLSISCQPKVQEMTDVERIEIDEIIKQLFLECE